VFGTPPSLHVAVPPGIAVTAADRGATAMY
jgi:hypothetical protein